MTNSTDLLAALAGLEPGSELAQAREVREAATRHAQGSYQLLFGQSDDDFSLAERFAIAALVAGRQGAADLQAHYAQRAQPLDNSPRHQLALEFARRLTLEPVSAGPQHIAALADAGWRACAIVTLAQLVGFVNFQLRLLAGLHLLQGESLSRENHSAGTASRWHTASRTASGKPAPDAFTRRQLGWEPWLAVKPLAEFSEQEQATLAHFGHSDSDYFRLLGRNLPLLEQRTLTDKGIFYSAGGLARAERELAATVASKVNGCIYCASVHARKAAQLAKESDAIDRLLDVPPGAALSENQSPRWAALIDFTAGLSATPVNVTSTQLQQVRAQGLTTLELLDLVQSTAFFAWANRLMLTLGEPFLLTDN